MRFGIAFFGFALAIAPAGAKEFEIFARLERDAAKCAIAVNSDFRSGSLRREIACPAGDFLSHAKYRLSVVAESSAGECRRKISGSPELLPPEKRLPLYPDTSETAKMLDCGS